jgi:multiple sugar transport system substrate-binding protein
MKVHHESLAEQQANQNLISDFGGAGSYDVFNTSLYLEKQRFYQAGWYAPLNDFIKNPALTAPDYDYDKDLFAAAKEAGTMPDGKIVALPVYLDPLVLFYRKDILQEKGLKPPTTYEELETLAKTLHNPPNLYGLVGRGQPGANVVSWVAPLRAWGGDWLTKEGKANLNSPEAVQALEYYARLLRSYSPPEVANFNWNEASAAFAQGQAALYWDVINVAGQFEDPAKSKVAGKVGYTALPMGQSQGQPAIPYFASALAVSSKARNKEAAYLFCEWATSKEVMLKAQLTGLAGPRQSAGNLPGVKSRMPPDWGDAWLNSLKSASPGFPAISNVAGFRDIAGAAISDALGGKEVKAALDKANQEFQKLLDSL